MKKALEGEKMSAVIAAVLGGTGRRHRQGQRHDARTGRSRSSPPEDEEGPEAGGAAAVAEGAERGAEEGDRRGQIQISMQPRGLVVSFTQAALFPSGEDVISPDAYEGLKKVAVAIDKIPNPVRLEGHTDSVPINTPRFRSNWELSAARSIALMELLCGKFSVPRDRLSIAGYADNCAGRLERYRRGPRPQPARGHRDSE